MTEHQDMNLSGEAFEPSKETDVADVNEAIDASKTEPMQSQVKTEALPHIQASTTQQPQVSTAPHAQTSTAPQVQTNSNVVTQTLSTTQAQTSTQAQTNTQSDYWGSTDTAAFKPAVAPVPPTTGTSARAAARQRKAAASTGAKEKKSGGGFKTFLLGFLGAALAFALGWGLTGGFNRATTPTPSVIVGAEEATTVEAVQEAENLAEAVAEKALPSVVAIDTYVSQSTMGGFWGYGATGNASDEMMAYGLGSGVVISSDGYILTNYHVIEGAEKVMVTIGGQEYEGTVAGSDPSSDLAVIKVESDEAFPAIEVGDSSVLKPGQWVMTLGSPFGLEQSVATGIISAVSRTVVLGSSDYSYGGQSETTGIYANMIQTDAAINPGNSGGALVDQNGHLIGINSVIESYSGSYSGVGFAIPVNYAMNIAQQIIDGKTPTHAQIGVSTTTIDASIAKRYGLSADKGAYISKVYENSGAAEAGLKAGDIIIKVDNTNITSSTDLVAAARAHTPGEQIEITYVRDTETQTCTVTLGSDENAELATGTSSGGESGGNSNGWGGNNGNGYNMDDLLEYFGYGDGYGYGYGDGYSDGYGGQGNGGQGNGLSMDDLLEYFGYGPSGNGQSAPGQGQNEQGQSAPGQGQDGQGQQPDQPENQPNQGQEAA